MPVLELSFESGESSLSVRRFAVQEAVSTLFTVTVFARSPDPSIDLAALVGAPATFRIMSAYAFARNSGLRVFSGIVRYAEQVEIEVKGLSMYAVTIVPTLWLLTQRTNNRIFQHIAIPDILDKLLDEWGIERTWEIDRGKYPKLEYKVQYGETDYAFFCRLLEEAGIAFTFPDDDVKSKLVLSDKLHTHPDRPSPPLPFVDNPSQASEKEFVSNVEIGHEVRPGAYILRDYDFRNPAFLPTGEAPKAKAPQDRLEQFRYMPGGSLAETGRGGGTPHADVHGMARHDQEYGRGRAERALAGERMDTHVVAFSTNTIDLWPGVVFKIDHHPHPELIGSPRLLVTEFEIEGSPDGEWVMSGRALFAEAPYLPPVRTPKPKVHGIQSATVVGPSGQEIHTDEFGRVRVLFPWDREGKNNEDTSTWIRVSQGWAGAGYGMLALPRIGQEVLVTFLEGDPDQPVILGRSYNAIEPVPYRLPENKTISAWKSDSSLGGNGFNELKFEDRKGDELVYEQAEKNLRKLVKNDETITVVRDRKKDVLAHETDTTGVNRTEVTVLNRIEVTGTNRYLFVGGNRAQWIKKDEEERTEGYLKRLVGKDVDVIVKGKKRERVEDDLHLHVKGDRREKVDGMQSLLVIEDQHEKVGGTHALAAGKAVHMVAGDDMVGEGGNDVTLKGPGGFVRIDATGVTIKGTIVKINAGGSAGKGKGSKPQAPEVAREAVVRVPRLPPPSESAPPGGSEWVEIGLMGDGEDPSPMAFAKYTMELADGSIREGVLDPMGKARVGGIAAGDVKVTFPDLDDTSWEE